MAHYQLAVFALIFSILGTRSYCETATASNDDVEVPKMAKEIEDNSRYKTLEANATLLKLLVDKKDGVSRSEVFDMLHSRDEDPQHSALPVFPEDAEDYRADVPAMPDSQAEFLQASDSIVIKDSNTKVFSKSRREPFAVAAGIMVAITLGTVILAYTTLIVWRRIYLKRNGLKHELLRNEENIAETRIEM